MYKTGILFQDREVSNTLDRFYVFSFLSNGMEYFFHWYSNFSRDAYKPTP